MVSLKTAGLRFNSVIHRADGLPFLGTIEQDLEGKLISYDFSYPRRLLRVQPESPIKTLDVIRDLMDRWWLVADHDGSFTYDTVEYRSHMLLPLVKQVSWERETKVLDPLTKQPKGAGREKLDDIWILPERVNREFADTTIRVADASVTVFTAAKLQLNDIVDGMVVKRIDIVRGVYLAEVQ